MDRRFETYKGIHPGIVVDRELTKRSLKKRQFASAIHEDGRTLYAVTKGKRSINPRMAIKIEQLLNLDEGTLSTLQSYYNEKKARRHRKNKAPNLSILRPSLFWDTNINLIDWEGQFKSIIKRVFERGNQQEKDELVRFYGLPKVESVIDYRRIESYHLQG